jgi:N-methylhydantoinase B
MAGPSIWSFPWCAEATTADRTYGNEMTSTAFIQPDPNDRAASADLDGLTLQLAWSRMIAIADEGAVSLIRGAISPIIRESTDLAVMIFDCDGNTLAQSTICIPSFIGTLPHTMRHFLRWRPVNVWRRHDVVATNDPWLGTGQLNDLSLATPIWQHDRPVGFVAVVAHLPDVGGNGGGNGATDTYEEGLHIPICLLEDAGVPRAEVFDFIRANVRLPSDVLSDIGVMSAAAALCSSKATAMLDSLGETGLERLGAAIRARSERATRDALGSVPPGRYTGSIMLEGFDTDLVIKVALIFDADSVAVDYSGSSEQIRRGINSTWSHTFAHTAFVLKCLLGPEIPHNEGSLVPITVSAPAGSVLNARPPAPGRSRTQVSHYISSLLFRVLGDVLPDRVLAEPGAPRPVLTLRGEREDGRPFSATYHVMAGMGAGRECPGLSVTAFPTNTRATPIEFIERTTPIRFIEKTLRVGSGGSGRWRGGDGQHVAVKFESEQPVRILVSPGRTRFPAQGLDGGGPGQPGSALLNGHDIAFKGDTLFGHRGDLLELDSAGGGGYGAPVQPATDKDGGGA